MNHQNEVLASVIEHLGIPLLLAVAHVNKTTKKAGAEREAQVAARLLSASVKLGMGLSAKMNLVSDLEEAEALRFRLTALSAHMISDHMSVTQKEVTEDQLDVVKAALDSVLSFSSHFSISTEGLGYLNQLSLSALATKEAVDLRTLDAMLPLVITVSQTPISVNSALLIQEISARLLRETFEFYEKLSQGGQGGLQDILAQQILKLLAACFISAYQAEIVLPAPSIDHVWSEFDRTKALVLVLCDYLVTGQKHIETTEGAGAAPAIAMPEPVQVPPVMVDTQNVQQIMAEPPPPLAAPPLPAKPAGDNSSPMSFFRKKD